MREIIVIDDQPPEDIAMMAAMYSRDPRSIKVHLDQVKQKGSKRFIETWYCRYGHKSIGDCGTTSLFIEYVSLLAAKAIQDHPLYSGQEASTRFLSMTSMPLIDPIGSPLSASVHKRWMQFYERTLQELQPHLRAQFPKKETDKQTDYDKSIAARCFDISRGFLPAGLSTLVAWHTNLRQAHDKLKELRHHPLAEVKATANETLIALRSKYPSSFGHKEYPAEEAWLAACAKSYYYEAKLPTQFSSRSFFEEAEIEKHQNLLASRPPKSELPHRFRRYGEIEFSFALDFGSFRDLQRQRSCTLEMPLLTPTRFAPWYLEQLPESLRRDAEFLIAQQQASLNALRHDGCSAEDLQYYCALGFEVPVLMTCNLPSALYISELRSGETVHPTLRGPAQEMGRELKRIFEWLPVYIDESTAWSCKRGTQDIVRKEQTA